MNKEKLLKLAEHIESLNHIPIKAIRGISVQNIIDGEKIDAFNMEDWLVSAQCGTAGCIAGHAIYLFQNDIPDGSGQRSTMCTAQKILCLDWYEAEHLFLPGEDSTRGDITPAQAANVLRLVADGIDPREAWIDELS